MLGSTINTDAADVAVLLSEYGIDVYWQTVVGDNPGRVIEAVRRAKDRADLIITTGGLGPTCDDLTKAALAEAFGMQLELNTEEEAWLRGVFKKRGYPELTPNNLQQVWLPEGSTALRNDWGTAPGCYFERGGVRVIMLPGPPREVRRVLELNAESHAFKALDSAVKSDTERARKLVDILHSQALLMAGEELEDPAAYTEEVCSLF